MKGKVIRISLIVTFITVILFFSSCNMIRTNVIRLTFEDLNKGAFYGGSLLFNPYEPNFSQLGEGTLIAFQDIFYGWEDEEIDYYTQTVKYKNYGYLYIKSISPEKMVYDYLVYDQNGRIIEKDDNVKIDLCLGEAVFLSSRGNDGFNGIVYHKDVLTYNPSIDDSYFLSFRHDMQDTEQSQSRDAAPMEEYRRILFRIQQPGNPVHSQFPRGIVAISASSPKSLVVNSSFYTEYDLGETQPATLMAFYNSENVPDFAPGDYVLGGKSGGVFKIEKVDTSDPDYILLETSESKMEDALGSVVIEVEGDLARIIREFGSEKDKAAVERARLNLIDKTWTTDILDTNDIKAEIDNTFDLDVDVSLKFHLSCTSFSCRGGITFPMSFSSILNMEAFAGFEEDDSIRLADPGVSFSISGIPVRVSVPIDFYYSLTAQLAKLDFEFGPELDVKLGFDYDLGAKVKFKYKIIPDGIKTWSHASGVFDHSLKLVGPTITFEDDPFLTAEIGFKTYPGVTIACVLRPEIEIPVALQLNLKDRQITLDFVTRGELEMKLDLKFYSHTFKFGRVFHYTKELYKSSF